LNPDHLRSTYLRLRPDCSVEPLPVDDQFWPRLMAGELGSFHHEYLVTSFSFDTDWPHWEMHPNGDEIVALMAGACTPVLEAPDGKQREVRLAEPGSFVLVPRGTWHIARVGGPTTMFFITPGEGTQHRAA
jgi:mannose-6-phosphate isomerase-like protein (cupin superfamily)